MGPACLFITLKQNGVAGIQVEKLDGIPVRFDLCKDFRQLRKRVASTRIDDSRTMHLLLGATEGDQSRQQTRREVVDGIVARILQTMQHKGLSGPRWASNHNKSHGCFRVANEMLPL